jgi:hypothetical protein
MERSRFATFETVGDKSCWRSLSELVPSFVAQPGLTRTADWRGALTLAEILTENNDGDVAMSVHHLGDWVVVGFGWPTLITFACMAAGVILVGWLMTLSTRLI